jgi:hypothetical protein
LVAVHHEVLKYDALPNRMNTSSKKKKKYLFMDLWTKITFVLTLDLKILIYADVNTFS